MLKCLCLPQRLPNVCQTRTTFNLEEGSEKTLFFLYRIHFEPFVQPLYNISIFGLIFGKTKLCLERFELSTPKSEVWCSIQLNYKHRYKSMIPIPSLTQNLSKNN